ncbi:MAG: tRNA (adenosine(37)-N6)-threonylcarbamoyltransferase complex ATPase subunit type 1 TsaE [Candidatus Goldbacteria bacterium]|nr:tRNA (adenosine(37)-N6)-threonylcarbamoyltransferase complex ATPase subunit type 1 TsaE [Candidatus Goldiibacteriota bacterium]
MKIKKNYILYKKYISSSPEDTKKIAQNLAKEFKKGDIVALIGQLGAGKTCFIKGIGKSYGIPNNEIASPTFVLLRIYNGKKSIYHFDLYRIKDYKELENIGYREFLTFADLIVIEWADKLKEIYYDFNWIIKIDYISKKQREIKIYKR